MQNAPERPAKAAREQKAEPTPSLRHRHEPSKDRPSHRIHTGGDTLAAPRLRHRHRGKKGRLSLEDERLVTALCRGYTERARRLASLPEDDPAAAALREDNALIDDALDEICEPELRQPMREDLARRRGAKYTQVWWLSERTYKERKTAVKRAILRRIRSRDGLTAPSD